MRAGLQSLMPKARKCRHFVERERASRGKGRKGCGMREERHRREDERTAAAAAVTTSMRDHELRARDVLPTRGWPDDTPHVRSLSPSSILRLWLCSPTRLSLCACTGARRWRARVDSNETATVLFLSCSPSFSSPAVALPSSRFLPLVLPPLDAQQQISLPLLPSPSLSPTLPPFLRSCSWSSSG